MNMPRTIAIAAFCAFIGAVVATGIGSVAWGATGTPTPTPALAPTVTPDLTQRMDLLEAQSSYTVDTLTRIYSWVQTLHTYTPEDLKSIVQATPTADEVLLSIVNTFPTMSLTSMPGVGIVTAQYIVLQRPFENTDQLLSVPGIGPATLTHIRTWAGVNP